MNKIIVVMTVLVASIFCTITMANDYNQTFLHLVALSGTSATEDDCRLYGMSPADLDHFSYAHEEKDGVVVFKLDTMTLEDISCLAHTKKIDINQRDSFGATALHYAAMANGLMEHWLLNNGASPYVVDDAGWNILHYAVAGGALDSNLGVLLSTYVDLTKLINQQDEDGNTPLHACVSLDTFSGKHMLLILNSYRDNCVRWLLDHGADVSVRNNGGYTPIDCANINYGGTAYGKNLLELMEAKTS